MPTTWSPAIFQRIMDTTLQGIDNVICCIDDILVSGATKKELLQTLSKVFERLDSAGFKLNQKKCKFEKSSVTYLGYTIDGEGLHVLFIMFYSRFLKDHATVLAPLNNLLRKDVKWKWKPIQEKIFQDAKKLLLDSPTLVHYNDCTVSPHWWKLPSNCFCLLHTDSCSKELFTTW